MEAEGFKLEEFSSMVDTGTVNIDRKSGNVTPP